MLDGRQIPVNEYLSITPDEVAASYQAQRRRH
jgi:hypothetical protein